MFLAGLPHKIAAAEVTAGLEVTLPRGATPLRPGEVVVLAGKRNDYGGQPPTHEHYVFRESVVHAAEMAAAMQSQMEAQVQVVSKKPQGPYTVSNAVRPTSLKPQLLGSIDHASYAQYSMCQTPA